MNRVIGLAGRARVGKNTVAGFIAELTDGPVHEAAFADLIKVSAARALGVKFHGDEVGLDAVRRWADALKTDHSIRIVGENGEQLHQITGRSFLQRYGTEAHRELFGDDFWVDAVEFIRPDLAALVLTDVRFENEAEAIHRAGGEVWRVERPSIDRATHQDSHLSEKPLPDELVDLTLVNDDDLEGLRAATALALEAFLDSSGARWEGLPTGVNTDKG